MTTMGSEYWPRTAEGQVLCLLLALYAFAAFGYVTATLATFFVGREATRPDGEVAGAADVAALRAEITALRAARPAGPRGGSRRPGARPRAAAPPTPPSGRAPAG
jgi:hypothetical protein